MSEFTSLKIVGGLLSSDLLGRVFAGDSQVPGTSPESYGLERGESVRRQASRSWPYLLETWQDEKKRDRWTRILLRELGFPHEMPSHIAFRALGWDIDLDHRTPHREARAPQSVLQEQLNREDSQLWGILCNGVTLRLLRDSATLVGSAYVEFDLQAIFDGELFSDFVLLYLACHESRFAIQGDGGPQSCYLEQWRSFAAEQGERALSLLRNGVQQAISILGTGFISHPANPQLRHRLASNELRLDDLNRALLRLVYRVLFWFVAEDRGALLQPDVFAETSDAIAQRVSAETRERYQQYFSAARLRRLARQHRGTRHTDLFEAVQLVFDGLGSEGGVPELALPGIGGIFETGALDEPVAGARLTNEALLSAVRALSLVKPRDGGAMRRVDFGNLGAEELGSIYESLLELIPHYDPDQRSYTLTVLPGNERKESGSYYTPTSLVECLLDSALDPLLDEATARGTAEEKVAALLDLTVCDPACGSGHFLVAAARRIAKRIAAEETGESEPPEPEIRKALRRVVGRCIYGVDVNPMAAELAKVSLWLEALEPGKPLSYLDQNIRVGNSLLGVTPALLADGLPDAAFTPIEGDDRKVCAALKKQNAAERQGQHDLFSQSGIPVSNAVLSKRADSIAHTLPDSLEDLHIHQQRQAEALAASSELRIQKLIADAWCAAFVQPKTEETRSTAITHAVIENFAADDASLNLAAAEAPVADVTRLYRFFHWHVEFPHIFRITGQSATGWSGGFSCVIGNPPWEKVELKEQEFFAQRSPEIASAPNQAARKRLIAALPDTDLDLHAEFANEQRKSAGWTHFLKESGRYPLTGHGRLNTYAVFAETTTVITSVGGRSGIIVPTGIATDATTAPFFRNITRQGSLVSLLDFRNNGFFADVAGAQGNRFCLLTLSGSPYQGKIRLVFRSGSISDILNPEHQVTVTPAEIALLNPNTGNIPIFRSHRDAAITIGVYRRIRPLWLDSPEENPWGLSFMQGTFNMASDSALFRTREQLAGQGWVLEGNTFTHGDKRMLPLYEAKMVHHFDHRFGDYRLAITTPGKGVRQLPTPSVKQHQDPSYTVLPRYWIAQEEVDQSLKGHWDKGWLLGWRDVTSGIDERTMICTILPRTGASHKLPLAISSSSLELLMANFSSFALDYVARQKIGGTSMAFFILKQLPVLPPPAFAESAGFIKSRVLELTYTAWEVEPFARDLGDDGPPFRWNEERRFAMRAELDATFFRLYGIGRDDVDYIMETFPIVKRKDVQQYGTFRTKGLILQIYDAMAEAARSGEPYQTILDPPPGHGLRHPAD
ncbi:N-6 DNA methylase [Trebonia sp.]|uniref:Eco57I restriction-modification methylase domain-containing protein n=1 Tax=Trebonia sp. TaxID=2767075 RepID=UPI0026261406|nr:N-6 DNA methylase [Trebonia sp.]